MAGRDDGDAARGAVRGRRWLPVAGADGSPSGSATGKFPTKGIEKTLSTTAVPSTKSEFLPETAEGFERNQDYSRFQALPRGSAANFSSNFRRRKSLPRRKIRIDIFVPCRFGNPAFAAGGFTGLFRRESTARKDSHDGHTNPAAGPRVPGLSCLGASPITALSSAGVAKRGSGVDFAMMPVGTAGRTAGEIDSRPLSRRASPRRGRFLDKLLVARFLSD